MSRRSHYNKRRQHQQSIYSDLPFKEKSLQLPEFANWVETVGGTCLRTTNQWEIARWRIDNKVGIIYRNSRDELTWTIISGEQYRQFLQTNPAFLAHNASQRSQ